MSEIKQNTQSKFLRTLATVLSYILHPLFMPVYISVAIYSLAPVSFGNVSHSQFHQWLGIIALSTIVFPMIAILLMKALGFIKSMMMEDMRDRIIPLMATMIFYFWVSHVFNSVGQQGDKNIAVPLILKVLLLGSFWDVIVIFMCNIFFKISMHATAAGSVIGIFILLMLITHMFMPVPFLIVLLIAAVMGIIRKILSAHTMPEIWLGYILGILVMLGAYWYM
jgi:hypothetical protein